MLFDALFVKFDGRMPKVNRITKDEQSNVNRSRGSDFFDFKSGTLKLGDGTTWTGTMPAWQSSTYLGEAVFNTGMVGYVESLTDPSYAGQILIFTYPMIGNYGVNIADGESDKIQVSGVVMGEAASIWSHAASRMSIGEWLHSQQIPLLAGVDTRALTKHLRTRGTMTGAISSKPTSKHALKLQKKFVSVEKPQIHGDAKSKTVILVDCGAKQNILRSLLHLGLRVKVVPATYDYTSENYHGVLLSNGPGDPMDYVQTIQIAKKALAADKPVFGICLGSQLMALAAGAKTYKLKFGHRGQNQPCLEIATQRAYITSQNHGYAVDAKTLPAGWRVNFSNLNDNSVEGIAHRSKPFFAVQFHPEACPGPTDTAWLFERFKAVL